MTEPSGYVEDVSKLKDTDEIKQAYVGLKDTNRYGQYSPFNAFHFITMKFTLFLVVHLVFVQLPVRVEL